MQVIITFNSTKSGQTSSNYITIEDVKSWSTTEHVLAVEKLDGALRYYPLKNIESFVEVDAQ